MDSLDDVVASLNELRIAAGSPSFTQIAGAVYQVRRDRGLNEFEARPARTTIYSAFQPGRRRLDAHLVGDLTLALGGSAEQAQALTRVTGRVQQVDRRSQVAAARTGVPTLTPLIGREAELVTLADLPEGSVVNISGLGGMGKSHLAFAAAKAALDRGDVDHVISVDLRGNNAELLAATPAAAREALLRALGQGGSPRDVDSSKQLLTQLLTARSAIIILDDAADASQIDGVLPADVGRARVLVTSRSRIDSPHSHSGATDPLVLGPLRESDAVDLLASALPPNALSADPIAARSLVESVGGIPLAIGLLGARLSVTTGWSLADHARRLSERLGQFRLETPIATAIDAAYSPLAAPARNALRQLAAAPVPTVASGAVATLWDLDDASARAVAVELERANLVQSRGGRLSLHDVVRAFAVDQGIDEDPESSRVAATDRLTDHLMEQAWAAHVGQHADGESCLYGAREAHVVPLPAASAAEWFDHEGENMLTLAATLEERRPDVILELSGALGPWLNNTWRHTDALWLHTRAVALTDPNDALAVARAKVALGYALTRSGDIEAADSRLEEALTIFQEADEVTAHMAVIGVLAINDYRAGRLARAADRFGELADLAHRSGSPYEEATYLGNAGATLLAIGQSEQAAVRAHEALNIARRENYPLVVVANLINLAEALVPMDRFADALAAVDEALSTADSAGPVMVGYARIARSKALRGLGRLEQAQEDITAAREIAASTGDDDLLSQLDALAAARPES